MAHYQYILKRWAARLKKFPNERAGQALFNTLHDEIPVFARRVWGKDIDPFYDDKVIESCLGALLKYCLKVEEDEG